MSSTNNPFANDNLEHIDLTGIIYNKYSEGLKKALYNFMHGIGLNRDLQQWFDFKVPVPTVSTNMINEFIVNNTGIKNELGAHAIWLGSVPLIKKVSAENSSLSLETRSSHAEWIVSTKKVEWIKYISEKCTLNSGNRISFLELADKFPGKDGEFKKFIKSEIWKEIRETVLLFV